MGTVEVVFDDILRQQVDVIVNPANRFMLHGGGLAALIAYAGGKEVVRESQEKAPIDTGEAIITTAGKLPFKAVVHTVGPVWGDVKDPMTWRQNKAEDTEDPDELLARAHINAVKLAAEHGHSSVAFPAVSCGVFRFPVERAAPIAIEAVRKAQEEVAVERVVFCLLDEEHYQAFNEANEKRAG